MIAAALDIRRRCPLRMIGAALSLERVLAAIHVAFGALLHFLNVVTGVVHVLLTECTDHKRGSSLACACRANVEAESVFPVKRKRPA